MATTRAKPAKRRRPPAKSSGTTDHGEQPLKIGKAARALGVEPYVLRFWETQFAFLRPRHAESSHRIYQARDLELLRVVKRLLHVDGYTIAGARKHIREVGLERLCGKLSSDQLAPDDGEKLRGGDAGRPDLRRALESIRDELQSVHKLLVKG